MESTGEAHGIVWYGSASSFAIAMGSSVSNVPSGCRMRHSRFSVSGESCDS